jgi:hypothetical protein
LAISDDRAIWTRSQCTRDGVAASDESNESVARLNQTFVQGLIPSWECVLWGDNKKWNVWFHTE